MDLEQMFQKYPSCDDSDKGKMKTIKSAAKIKAIIKIIIRKIKQEKNAETVEDSENKIRIVRHTSKQDKQNSTTQLLPNAWSWRIQ